MLTDDERDIIRKLIADKLIEPAEETADGLEYNVLKRPVDADFVTLMFWNEGCDWTVEKNRRGSGDDCVFFGDLDGADSYIRHDLD